MENAQIPIRVITVAVIFKNGKVLLGQKAPGKGPYPNTWHFPGGGVETGTETIDEALKRELTEEVHIIPTKYSRLFFHDDFGKNKHGNDVYYIFLMYLVTDYSGKERPGDDLVKLQWFSINELEKIPLPEPSIRILPKLLEKLQ